MCRSLAADGSMCRPSGAAKDALQSFRPLGRKGLWTPLCHAVAGDGPVKIIGRSSGLCFADSGRAMIGEYLF